MWIEPIVDRTAQDITLGTAKGFCNARDLNRIEDNCREVAAMLGVTIQLRNIPWSAADFPIVSELARITANVRLLDERYMAYQTTPPPPENPLNHWQKWNDAEKILLDIHKSRLEHMAALIHCGEMNMGEGIGVI
ncbi:MAG: hypothetical protein RSF86_13885 [Angelakisella sp.]